MFIGLDLGTTNVKAVLADAAGRILRRASVPVRLIHVGEHGVEQDMAEIRAATFAALAGLGEERRRAAALGVSAQGGAVQSLDAAGRPLGRTVSWLDARAREHQRRFTERFGREWFVRHSGTASCNFALRQLVRIKEEQPALLAAPNRIGYVGDVIVGELCGCRARDATSLSVEGLFNPALRAPDPELLGLLGIRLDQLPELRSVRAPAGGLRKDVADQIGLPAGIPVSAAVHDQYAAALGAGVIRPGDVMFGAGTAWVFVVATENLTEPVSASAHVVSHPVQGVFGQMLSMGNGGSCFCWAVDLMGLSGKSPAEIDALIASVPVGAGGIRCRPLFASGGAGLASGIAGRLDGLRLSHGPGNVLRAVTEGLACELARHLALLNQVGARPARLVMCGGAAASRITPQIVADVTGLPVACAREPELSALGAAMVARGLVEPRAGLADVFREMAPAFGEIHPGPDAPAFRRLFEEYTASRPAQADL